MQPIIICVSNNVMQLLVPYGQKVYENPYTVVIMDYGTLHATGVGDEVAAKGSHPAYTFTRGPVAFKKLGNSTCMQKACAQGTCNIHMPS